MPILHHTGVTVADLDRSLHFWRDAMGMEVLFQQEKAGGYLEAIVGEPGAHVLMADLVFGGEGPRIELFQYPAPGGGQHRLRPADQGFVHIRVAGDDLDEQLHLLAVREVVLGLHRTIGLTLSPGRIVHRYPGGPA